MKPMRETVCRTDNRLLFKKLVLLLCTCMSPKVRIEFSVSWMRLYPAALSGVPCRGHSAVVGSDDGSDDGKDGTGWMEEAGLGCCGRQSIHTCCCTFV